MRLRLRQDGCIGGEVRQGSHKKLVKYPIEMLHTDVANSRQTKSNMIVKILYCFSERYITGTVCKLLEKNKLSIDAPSRPVFCNPSETLEKNYEGTAIFAFVMASYLDLEIRI